MRNSITSFINSAILIAAFVILPTAAGATCAGKACNGIYIDMLYPNNTATAKVYIQTTGDESLLTDCTAFNGNSFTLEVTTDAAKAIYSTLLAALTADRPIDVVGVTGSNECEIAFVRYRR